MPIAEILTLEEAIQSEQTVARGALANVELSLGEQITLPNGVLEIDGQRAGIRCALPALGEHTEEVLSNLKNNEQVIRTTNEIEHDYPLKGLRVLDLGVIVVGAEQGRLLGDYGAEVIKIESFAFPDGGRQSLDGSPMNASVAAGHRNKRSLGLNLREEKGKELFSKLLEHSDVLLTNFKPGTLEKLGFDQDTLLEINPRLITLDSSAFGPTGPWARRLGYGPLVRASAGMTGAWRCEDDEANFYDAITVYPDHVAARIGVMGVLSLLIRRERTGKGGSVSVSLAEVMLSHMAPEIAKLTSANADRSANQDAPWGVYPCAGDDEWCVVTIRNNKDWKALCSVMDFTSFSEDVDLEAAAGRLLQKKRIEEAVKDRLADKDPKAAMKILQEAGVPAAAMLRVSELPGFKHFEQRGMYKMTEHPMLSEAFYQELGPVNAQHMQEPLLGNAPMVGEQTIEIMKERFDCSIDEIDALIEANVLEVANIRE